MAGAFRFLTAGESHGEGLTAVIEGLPAGLPLTEADIDADLARRQRGYGRGGRMKIERDHAHISSGVRWGVTLGSPLTLNIQNRDWGNWKDTMAVGEPPTGAAAKAVTRPRPGHAAVRLLRVQAARRGCAGSDLRCRPERPRPDPFGRARTSHLDGPQGFCRARRDCRRTSRRGAVPALS